MDAWENLWWAACAVGIILAMAAIVCVVFMPHTFNGYYLANGHIWSSYEWAPDERAYDYNEKVWQDLVCSGLVMQVPYKYEDK